MIRRGARRERAFAAGALLHIAALVTAPPLAAAPPTPGYPEPVVQWGVQAGETCESVAIALYGSAEHVPLLHRYNRIACTPGAPLREGSTLVVPAAVTQLPAARLESLTPQVRARPPGGGWSEAAVGQPLTTNSSVNTRETGRAGIGFADRTRIVLAENTLVVIYGTASQSLVSSGRPPSVLVEEGEARAALAALRGGGTATAVEVAIAGGRVTAASNETIIEKKGKRATVSVFDGQASVESAGKKVEVPLNHGSRFVEQQPPSPPRPLPPPPAWSAEPPAIVLAWDGTSTAFASWAEVARAKGYRVEIARDPSFTEILLREEVAAAVRSFRAEGLPAGDYHLRVRAIDHEDYLGVATAGGGFRIVPAAVTKGAIRVQGGRLVGDEAAVLTLSATDGLEAGTSEASLSRAPPEIALASLDGGALWLRAPGGKAAAFPVVIERPAAPPPPPSAPAEERWLGPTLPLVPLGSRTDVILTAPTARDAIAIAAIVDGGPERDGRIAGRAFASGAIGPASFEALITSDADDGVSAWLGARARVMRLDAYALEIAPVLRLGVPTEEDGVARLDGALALGGEPSRGLTWIGNAGARVRLGDGTSASPDGTVPYLTAGTSLDVLEWMRLFGAFDAQVLVAHADGVRVVQPGGGLTLGAEAGAGPFFTSLGGRFSPFFERRTFGGEPLATVQLGVGLRR